jgi:hypothetical protein
MNQAMEIEKMSNLALLLVLALCMSQPLITNASVWPSYRYIVHIENRLSNHTLQAHCKSGDQDLGLQNISLGEEFQWGFYINFWGTTLYFCNLSWPGGHKTFDVFTTYFTFLYYKCEPWIPFKNQHGLNCVWRAQDDGIYLFDVPTKKYYLQHTWEH